MYKIEFTIEKSYTPAKIKYRYTTYTADKDDAMIEECISSSGTREVWKFRLEDLIESITNIIDPYLKENSLYKAMQALGISISYEQIAKDLVRDRGVKVMIYESNVQVLRHNGISFIDFERDLMFFESKNLKNTFKVDTSIKNHLTERIAPPKHQRK